jgi:hypothetical protein
MLNLLDYLAGQATGQPTTPAPMPSAGVAQAFQQIGAPQPQPFPTQARPLLSGSPRAMTTPAAGLGPNSIRQQFSPQQYSPMAQFKRQVAQAMKG